MTTTTPAVSKSPEWLVPGLILLIAFFIGGNLARLELPLLGNDRLVLIAVFFLGQVLCSQGMRIGTFSWTHPSTIIGIALGILLYGVVLLHLFGVNLPSLETDQAILVFLGAVIGIKVLIDLIRMRIAHPGRAG